MNRLLTNTIALTFLLALSTSVAFAVDTDMWENTFRVQTGMQKGMKATEMLKNVLGDEVTNKKNTKLFSVKTNDFATATLKKPYKDIVSLSATQKAMKGKTAFGLTYTFKPDSMLLLDILGRYGNICDVQTNSQMGRLINIVIHKNIELNSDHPLRMLVDLLKKMNSFQ